MMQGPSPSNDIRRFLFVELVQNEVLFSCLTGGELRSRTTHPSTSYRVSPIYPVVPLEGTVPQPKSDFCVGFFFFEDPGVVIGRLIADLPKHLQPGLWFSHGLASIILFAKKRSDFEAVKLVEPKRFRGMEIWTIKDGKVHSPEVQIEKAAKIDEQICQIVPSAQLDTEIQGILNELRHCLNTAVSRAAQFLPSSLKSFERLYPAVNDIILELEKVENGNADHSDPLLARQKRKQQLVDQLIQINAALSYVISQAYAGIIPILQHECQIRKFSFLGVGSAHNGMAAFTEFCELTFQNSPVDAAIKRDYKKGPGFPFEYTGSGETPKEWNEAPFNVDYYIGDFPPEHSKLNLAYFSGRLGFRETQFTVTAPLQTLMQCSKARWSLMTLTHELMHAHVRAILGALFSFLHEDPNKGFQSSYERYRKKFAEGKKPQNLLETIQFIIFGYCDYKPGVDRGAQKLAENHSAAIEQPVLNIDSKHFATRLQQYYREINEILVHVLDFNYFYDCREEPYLILLWTSWSPVASVIDNVDEYLLRSILAISSKIDGNTATRFSNAVERLQRVLNTLQIRYLADPLFSYAIERLNDSVARKQLLAKFSLGLYLVDLAQKSFVCKRIHSGLYTDTNRVKSDLDYEYILETGAFEPVPITSPVALVSDLLRREAKGEISDLPTEYVSTWLFLTLASAPIERIENVS